MLLFNAVFKSDGVKLRRNIFLRGGIRLPGQRGNRPPSRSFLTAFEVAASVEVPPLPVGSTGPSRKPGWLQNHRRW